MRKLLSRLCGSVWLYLTSFLNPTNLPDALRVMVYFLFVAGLSPYRLTANKSATKRCSIRVIFGRILSIIILFILFDCFFRTLRLSTVLNSSFDEYPLFRTVDMIMVTVAMWAMCLVYLSPIWKRYAFLDIVHILVVIDRSLQRLGIKPRHQRTVFYIVTRLLLNGILYGLYIFGCFQLFLIYKYEREIYSWISYFAPQYVLWQIVFKYMTITELLRIRFRSLNKVSVYDNP